MCRKREERKRSEGTLSGCTLSVIGDVTVQMGCFICYMLCVKGKMCYLFCLESGYELRCIWKGSIGDDVHLPSMRTWKRQAPTHPGDRVCICVYRSANDQASSSTSSTSRFKFNHVAQHTYESLSQRRRDSRSVVCSFFSHYFRKQCYQCITTCLSLQCPRVSS